MKIRYVGKKELETAFQEKTGLVWTPDAVHEVDDATATRMLLHPDVFARADQVQAIEQSVEVRTGVLPTILYEAVVQAQQASGLSIADWNALPEDDRLSVVFGHKPAVDDDTPSFEDRLLGKTAPPVTAAEIDALDGPGVRTAAAILNLKPHPNSKVETIRAKVIAALAPANT